MGCSVETSRLMRVELLVLCTSHGARALADVPVRLVQKARAALNAVG
jgi:hypothetical protein